MASFSLSKQDRIDILEDLAKNAGNAAARIAAVKELERMQAGEAPAPEGFAELDELAEKRQAKAS